MTFYPNRDWLDMILDKATSLVASNVEQNVKKAHSYHLHLKSFSKISTISSHILVIV